MNFEGSSGPCPTIKQEKEKTKAKKKEKILTKLVVGKEDKRFDMAKCRLVDDMLGNEFLGCFPFGNDPPLGVSIDVHHFKITPPNIVLSSTLGYPQGSLEEKHVFSTALCD